MEYTERKRNKLSLLNPPRWINFSSDSEVAELHIFADDSNMACGTTGHIKTVHQISLNIVQFSFLGNQSTVMFIIF